MTCRTRRSVPVGGRAGKADRPALCIGAVLWGAMLGLGASSALEVTSVPAVESPAVQASKDEVAEPSTAPAPADQASSPATLGAGFRYSAYGPDYDPGPEYWAEVGRAMAAKIPGSVPETVWIAGRLHGEGTLLNFPAEPESPLIAVSERDDTERLLTLFDEMGGRVWLQVEPGNAPVEELIDLILGRYGHHPSVTGFGVDVEWYRSVDAPIGQRVSDEEARAWLAAIRRHVPDGRLFLKHWLVEKMPPTERDGILFIDDSQFLPSLDAMIDEFAAWGRALAPAEVGFQYGYASDRPWWRHLDDPPGDIAVAILERVPNAAGFYWVDFTVLDLFPPEPVIGVKIYDHEGDPAALVERWVDTGITTAYVSEKLAGDAALRRHAAAADIDVFLITPVFYDPEALTADPDLFAVQADGSPAKDDWVEFACPSRPDYRERRIDQIVERVRRLEPDGVSLDFIRQFVFWERVLPDTSADDLPEACFCAHCLAGFAEATGIELPEGLAITEAADRIRSHHADTWVEWKVDRITSMVEELTTRLRAVDATLRFNLHAVPWRADDYDGARRRIAGQDLAALSVHVDTISPMTYAFMLERPFPWVGSVVREMAEVATVPILPSVQVGTAYRDDAELSVDEFWLNVHAALEPPSSGVVFWSWEALAKEPAKLAVVREALSARRGAPIR